MLYYERIQQALAYIEEGLGSELVVEEVAAEAFPSVLLTFSRMIRLFP